MALDSYSGLVAAVQDWMNRNDLSGAVQDMIALAEGPMRRRLEPLFSEVSASIAATNGVASLPGDFGTLNRVVYDNAPLPRYSGFTAAELGDPTYSPEPLSYTVEANAIRLWPQVSATVTVFYQPTLPALTDTAQTNIILQKFPDLYFYGAMLFAEGYVANDARAVNFAQLYDKTLEEAETYLSKQRYSGPLVPMIWREQ